MDRDELLRLLQEGQITPEAYERLSGEPPPAGDTYTIGDVGDDAVAVQGDGSMAAGAGAQQAQGNIVDADRGGAAVGRDMYGNVTINNYAEPRPGESPADTARRIYLHWLITTCDALHLLDAATGGEVITLADVYIDLNTTTKFFAENDHGNDAERLVTAGEALTDNKRLALLGKPGSGKSSFVRHTAARYAQALLQPENGDGLFPILFNLRELAPILADLTLDRLTKAKREQALLGAVFALWGEVCANWDAADLTDTLDQILRDGRVFIVFDGLDEVADTLRQTVRDTVYALDRMYPKIEKIVVTSRIRSWEEGILPDKYRPFTLASFNEAQIHQFVTIWYEAQVTHGRYARADADERISDLQAAAVRPELQELAQNPLLLTSMALIHQRNHTLPRQRVVLYKETVALLLYRWQEQSKGQVLSDELAQVVRDDHRIRPIMQEIAYRLHEYQQRQKEGKLSRGELITLLEEEKHLGTLTLADEFLDYIDQRAGLLGGLGGRQGKPKQYDFPHRTFQEYLAGCHIFGQRQIGRELGKLAAQGDYWYVPVMLGAEELFFNNPSSGKNSLLDIAYGLCAATPVTHEAQQRLQLWSAGMGVVVGEAGIRQDDDVVEGGEIYLERIRARLLELLASQTPVQERAEAGRLLAHLKDSRKEVLKVDKMRFCWVPPGPFWLGEPDEGYLYEGLDYGYWLGEFPVTNSQYARFVAEKGYGQEKYWTAAIQAGVWQDGFYTGFGEKRNAPARFAGNFHLPNYPVVGVSWYEGLAFCEWLTEHGQAEGWLTADQRVILPNEPEWEKGARGGTKQLEKPGIQAIDGGLVAPAPTSELHNQEYQRLFPWGDDAPTEYLANIDDLQLGSTTAVGVFPQGKTVAGCQEMSGNVYEWTRSLEKGYPYDPADGRETLKRGQSDWTILRGGSWYMRSAAARVCARDDGGYPDYGNGDVGFRCAVVPSSSLFALPSETS